MEEKSVCFMCARCKQLVKLDSSFDSIDDKTIQDLASSSIALSSNEEENISKTLTCASEPAKNVVWYELKLLFQSFVSSHAQFVLINLAYFCVTVTK